jgi:heavy metal sensor kinase
MTAHRAPPRSIRWRLTLWYGLTLGFVLAAFALGSLAVLSRVLQSRSDRHLEEARGAFVAELVVEFAEMGNAPDAVAATLRDTRFRDTWAYVFDSMGKVVGPAHGKFGSSNNDPQPLAASVRADEATRRNHGKSSFVAIDDEDGGFRGVGETIRLGGVPYTVVAVDSRHGLRETLMQVALGYMLVIPLAIALTLIVGYWLARRSLAPMAEMSRATRAIGAGNLHERLPVSHPGDEVGQLAEVVNDLLARLESAFEQQRRFVADASHELRTPVATVCAEAEVVLARETRDEAEYRDSLHVVRDAGRRLSRIVDDLFLLARADSGHLPLRPAPLYLDELIVDVARSMRAMASARGVRVVVETPGDAPATGDAALLERLLLNLLDNAIKHTRPGSDVRVRLSKDDGRYVVRVIDSGAGIPVEARAKVFERFYRVDRARSRGGATATGGAGLGLAIGRWIAEAHGGTLDCGRSDDSGTEFVAVLPATGM